MLPGELLQLNFYPLFKLKERNPNRDCFLDLVFLAEEAAGKLQNTDEPVGVIRTMVASSRAAALNKPERLLLPFRQAS